MLITCVMRHARLQKLQRLRREWPFYVFLFYGIARDVIRELDDRFQNCFSDLNRMLAECFDFARLIAGVCGTRSVERSMPVNKKRSSELGAEEFHKCVFYVSQMPHVKDRNLELGDQLSAAVFWALQEISHRSCLGRYVCFTLFPLLQEDCRES